MTRALVRQALALYPQSRAYRRQWLAMTVRLMRDGKHILWNGEAKWGNFRKETSLK